MYRRGNSMKDHENFQLHYWSKKYKLRLHKISITLFFIILINGKDMEK